MKITINGKSEETAKKNLNDIIIDKGFCVDNLVVEHNRQIVPKNGWSGIMLNENDNLEIISFVGGG